MRPIRDLINQACTYYSSFEFKQAAIVFRQAIAAYPESIVGYLGLARCIYRLSSSAAAKCYLQGYLDRHLDISGHEAREFFLVFFDFAKREQNREEMKNALSLIPKEEQNHPNVLLAKLHFWNFCDKQAEARVVYKKLKNQHQLNLLSAEHIAIINQYAKYVGDDEIILSNKAPAPASTVWQRLWETAQTMTELTCQPFSEVETQVDFSVIEPLLKYGYSLFSQAAAYTKSLTTTIIPENIQNKMGKT